MQLADLLERKLEDNVARARYWGPVLGAWTILVSLAFGLFSLTDWAQPVARLGPFLTGIGVLVGLMHCLTKFKPRDD